MSDLMRDVDPVGKPAPDFSLPDGSGNAIALSGFRGIKNIILVLNRGFF